MVGGDRILIAENAIVLFGLTAVEMTPVAYMLWSILSHVNDDFKKAVVICVHVTDVLVIGLELTTFDTESLHAEGNVMAILEFSLKAFFIVKLNVADP